MNVEVRARTVRRFGFWYSFLFLLYAIGIGLYLRYASGAGLPPEALGTAADPNVFMDPDVVKESAMYSSIRNWSFFIAYPLEWGAYGLLLLSGAVGTWMAWCEKRRIPGWLQLPVVLLALQAALFAVFLPLRIFGYTMALRFGVSTQPLLDWVKDRLIGFSVQFIIMLVVLSVVLWVVRRGGAWWLKLWLLSIPFTLFMMYIQPIVIDPLYETFTRLSDSKLEASILELASRADIPADRVYEVKVSDKTNALNAYVNGIGGSLRIVLWDTTLQRMTEDEILFIMAHEMGHYVYHHLEWTAVGAIAVSFILLLAAAYALPRLVRRYGGRFGLESLTDLRILPLLFLLISVFSFVSLPVENAVSRSAERAADRYAMELLGHTRGAITMYQKLAAASKSEMYAPPIVRFFRSTHPSLMERILYVEQVERNRVR